MATVADVIAGLVRWVGGKVVVSDGRVVTVDEDRVIAVAHRSARALAGRTGL